MTASVLDMPRLGETMEEGQIVRWLKAPGEDFVRGETLLEVETDKTLVEVPALAGGTLVEIIAAEGSTIAVGAPIARIAAADSARKPSAAAAMEPAAASPQRPLRTEAVDPAPVRRAFGAPVRATPLARRIARDGGLVIAGISGSGRRGRIEAADVRAALSGRGDAVLAPASPDPVVFLDVGGQKLAYVEAGPKAGPPVLLLHGFGADHTAFAALTASLARRGFHVAAPDLAGHGATALPASGVSELEAGLVDLVRRLGIDRDLHLVAHSLGAAAALALTVSGALAPSRLTLIAPAGMGYQIDSGFVAGLANARTTGELSHLLRRLSLRDVALSAPTLVALLKDISSGRLVALADAVAGPAGQRLDLLPALRQVARRLPVQVIVGVEDRVIPWTQVAGLPPRVAIHILARSGHMPHWDQLEDVLDIISS